MGLCLELGRMGHGFGAKVSDLNVPDNKSETLEWYELLFSSFAYSLNDTKTFTA